ncbi:Uncharacterized protein HZ326_28735 [Fusarium oxysporum f. sp. albedinis]|nr:Uncharacterized protein HZ326_28735 [Fusarium oxysporum f. sp. albedinis]
MIMYQFTNPLFASNSSSCPGFNLLSSNLFFSLFYLNKVYKEQCSYVYEAKDLDNKAFTISLDIKGIIVTKNKNYSTEQRK